MNDAQNKGENEMKKEAKMMLNMAESISTFNNVEIERLDLKKVHMGDGGRFDYYVLNVWYSDGKEIRIREDCTIVK